MKPVFSFRSCTILAGPVLSSLSVYFILSNLLLFPSDIAITLSVILFSLLLGLSIYLLVDKGQSREKEYHSLQNKHNIDSSNFYHNRDVEHETINVSNFLFIALYVLAILIVVTSKPHSITDELFISWEEIFTSPILVIQLVAAVLLSFFFPGYALVYLLLKVCPLKSLPKILLSFLLSMLIAGFCVYVATIMIGVPVVYLKPIIIGVDVLVLILFVLYNKAKKMLSFDLPAITSFFLRAGSKFRIGVTTRNVASFLVFASLLALVVFYTCYLEKGVIVGDQWFHHGRALLISSGTFKDFAATGAGKYNPPFFPALLAGFFSLSGVPSVNAYVSANILNMMAIFAFHYFFSRWVPVNQRNVAILATTLFVLSSGFGWVLVLGNTFSSDYYHSQESTLENLHWASIRSSDIRTPNTFINVGHPTFTTPLIIVALPAGFVLLGLIKEQIYEKGGLRFISIITAIMVLGILSHPEFFLFIIVGSILMLSFRITHGNFVYASIMSALFICLILDFLSPQNYNTATTILNIPLLILCLVFVSILWVSYRTRILSYLHRLRSAIPSFHFTKFVNSGSKNASRIVIISVLAYIYVISYFVLEALPNDDIQIQVGTSTQRNIPWYLYPIKFGVAGLIGFAFIISYVFKRFEKETFVFAIIAATALFAGPYYDEHRFSKYLMVAMVGFASIFVYKIILFLQRPSPITYTAHQKRTAINIQLRPVACSILIAVVVTSAGLSVFMLAGYKAVGYKSPQFQEDFFRVNFPSESERNLLKFFGANLPDLATNFVAIQANDSQTTKINSELQGFSAVPRIRILQNPQSLNASTLEGLFYSLDYDNIRYIILVKSDIHSEQQLPGPFKFALDNFERAYDNDTYIVLKVPDFSPPLSLSEGTSDIGLVYNKRNDLPLLLRISNDTNNSNTVQDNYKFFNNIENSSELIVIENKVNASGYESKNGETETLILHGDKKAKTLWSNVINGKTNVNYVEGKFRLIAENKTRNDFGIKMEDTINNQQYYVSFDGDWLKLIQKSNLEKSYKELVLSQDPQLPQEQRGLWHTLKILVLKDTVNIYLDDILKIRATKFPFAENFSSISKIGIAANKNIVQFEPLKIGYISDSAFESYQKTITREISNHLYYPVTALSLSKLRYETFMDDDLSVFSKKNVVLTSDPKLEFEEGINKEVEKNAYQFEERISKEKFDIYLDFVRSGGTIIVLNSDGNSSNSNDNSNKTVQGVFSKLLSLQYGKKVKFNGIFSNKEHSSINKPQYDNFINISGVATDIEFSNSSDIVVKAYYVDLNNNDSLGKMTVAPFTIEKKYGAGKIILVNTAGYFDSIIKSSDPEFMTLGDIPNMIDLKSKKQSMSPIDSQKQGMAPVDSMILAAARIIGDMKISDYTGITIKSTSLVFNGFNDKAAEAAPSYNLTINKISTSPYMLVKTNDSYYDNSLVQQNLNQNTTPDKNILLSDVTIRELKLYGPYEIIIKSNDKPFHLSTASSYYDYAALAVPKGFDVLFKPSQGAYLQFTLISCPNNDNSCQKQVRVSNSSEVFFHNVNADSQFISSLPILVKSPEIITENAAVKFKLAPNINNLTQPSGNILADGNIALNFDHVETYDSYHKNGTKTDPVSYLKSLNIGGKYSKESQQRDSLLLPGEISERAKDKRIGVPWQEAILSFTGIMTFILIIAVVTGVNYYLWPKVEQYNDQLG